jgi:uncharacterized protein (DUF58 family)
MIDPEFLDELDRFESALKRQASSVQQGEQQSRHVGEGLTFSDYRRYVPGDDTRLVDWKLYARTEEYFVKQYEEERSLTVHVLVDASESMDFGEGETHKFEYGAKLGLAVAYLTSVENNDFRFSVFTDEVDRLDTGASTRAELLRVIELLNERDPAGEADFEAVLEGYAERIHSRALVVVVSDFLGDPDAVEAGVTALARNDTILAHVLAPEERDPDATGDTIFQEPETGETRRTYFGGSLAQSYRDRLQAHVDDVAERADTLRAEHVLVDTGDDFFDSVGRLWFG